MIQYVLEGQALLVTVAQEVGVQSATVVIPLPGGRAPVLVRVAGLGAGQSPVSHVTNGMGQDQLGSYSN